MKSLAGCIFSGLLFVGNVKAQTWPDFHLTNGVHDTSYGVKYFDPLNPVKNLYIDPVAVLNAGATELDVISDENEVFLNGGAVYASAIDANNFTWNSGSLYLNGGNHRSVYGSLSSGVGKKLFIDSGAGMNLSRVTVGNGNVLSTVNEGHLDFFLEENSGQVIVRGDDSLIRANNMILGWGMYSYANRLLIESGGTVQASVFRLSGTLTSGVPYPDLENYVSVSGVNSKLDISGNLNIGNPSSTDGHLQTIPCGFSVNSGGELTVGGSIYISNSSLVIGSEGQLTVKNNFNASMAGLNLASGATLAVGGQLSGLPVLEAARRLEASDVLGALTVDGTFAPGNSPADSIVNGALTISSDGILEMELGGYELGTEYDRLTVTGFSSLEGNLDLVFLNNFSPTNGASFDLFNWEGGVSGSFENDTNLTALASGLKWDISELYTTGTLNVIPEPGIMGLMVICGGGFWFVRRFFLI